MQGAPWEGLGLARRGWQLLTPGQSSAQQLSGCRMLPTPPPCLLLRWPCAAGHSRERALLSWLISLVPARWVGKPDLPDAVAVNTQPAPWAAMPSASSRGAKGMDAFESGATRRRSDMLVVRGSTWTRNGRGWVARGLQPGRGTGRPVARGGLHTDWGRPLPTSSQWESLPRKRRGTGAKRGRNSFPIRVGAHGASQG